ncbi:acyltransferase [Polynucleobacter paneuropaeus]|uniref:Acyltransferase n=1 Tax=Polynucleobacter paneuropaeus TaxID=2527775 RepID=A0A9Q2WKC2_9BURK|nr:acyltransferase [Polynucleobacter paneuropaeus]
MKYRPEIDGLRAIAVLSVILFHAGFTIFSGGFVGVDIFFVISGYLITVTIIDEIENKTFSFAYFYERRARRILPALFLVMLCTLPFAFLLMMPSALKSYSKSLIAVPLFVSNILFSYNDYFDVESELKPLLHTWSLGVEEQYYALAPILLVVAWKIGKIKIIFLASLLALTSLIIAQLLLPKYSTFAFYSLVTRSFEIIIGALVALLNSYYPKINQIPKRAASILTLTSMALIVMAVSKFDAHTPSPSYYTLIPTICAGLIILYANSNNLVGVILRHKYLVSIGLISYSSYLWHQPLFAFSRLLDIKQQSNYVLFSLCLASLFLGYFTWRFIEARFRDREKINTKYFVFISIVFSIAFIAIGFFGYKYNYSKNFNEIQKEIISYDNYDYSKILRPRSCFIEQDQTYKQFGDDCFAKSIDDVYLIWGDSYAAASSYGVKSIHKDLTQLTSSSCPPFFNVDIKDVGNCRDVNDYVRRKIIEIKPAKIFLQAKWNNHSESLDKNLSDTLKILHAISPSSKVIVIGSVPQWEPSLPMVAIQNNLTLDTGAYIEMPSYKKLKEVDAQLERISKYNQAEYLGPLDNLCKGQNCLAVVKYNSKYWLTSWDSGHLTEAGSVNLYRLMEKSIKIN